MENRENPSSGGIAAAVTVTGEEAPESYRVEPRTEAPPNPAQQTPTAATVPEVAKKRRGRPRKYNPDGTPNVRLALSPMPISASIPLAGDLPTWKRGRGRPANSSLDSSAKKSQSLHHNNNNVNKFEVYESQGQVQAPGHGIAYSVGANFTPHVLTVNAGEDVTMKVMTFSQQGARAICILSANGTISNVTLRQPTSSGGTLTYEGRFEILSLSGSYMPTETAGTKSRSGGMSVSLAGPDGRVVGGGLAGLLVAAGPVQVVVGSFLPGHQQEQKAKKPRIEPAITTISPPVTNSIPGEESRGFYGSIKPIVTPAAFNLDGSNSSPNPIQPYRNSVPENITNSKSASLPEDESKGHSNSNCEVSC